MNTIRIARILTLVAVTALLLATVAPAADAPQAVAKIKASISPKKVGKAHNGIGTPVKLTVNTSFSVTPAGADPLVIDSATVLFPQGAITNGKLFPSCSAAQLNRAHGVLSRCPKGSIIGGGSTTAHAIELDLTATAKVTLLNGPKGKSVTFNIDVKNPAQINESFDAPIVKTHGKYGYKLSLHVPPDLQTIIGSRIAVQSFNVSTKATIIQKIHGKKVKRGFIEALKCPKSHKAPIHLDVTFLDGPPTSTDSTVACS